MPYDYSSIDIDTVGDSGVLDTDKFAITGSGHFNTADDGGDPLVHGDSVDVVVTFSEGGKLYTVNETASVDHVKKNGDFTWTINISKGEHSHIPHGLGEVQVTFPGLISSTESPYDSPPCFVTGTLIRTPEGEVAVESLELSDLVLTADGRAEPVAWIGLRTVVSLFADPILSFPVRVRAGALADGVPARDLLLSPDHALLVDGVLVQAGALVNGLSIVRETEVAERFTYYHVELADHSLILAEGAAAETFVDNVGRQAFDNWAEHEALYPEGRPIVEMALPRAKAHRQVPGRVRERLMARAAELFGEVAASAA